MSNSISGGLESTEIQAGKRKKTIRDLAYTLCIVPNSGTSRASLLYISPNCFQRMSRGEAVILPSVHKALGTVGRSGQHESDAHAFRGNCCVSRPVRRCLATPCGELDEQKTTLLQINVGGRHPLQCDARLGIHLPLVRSESLSGRCQLQSFARTNEYRLHSSTGMLALGIREPNAPYLGNHAAFPSSYSLVFTVVVCR